MGPGSLNESLPAAQEGMWWVWSHRGLWRLRWCHWPTVVGPPHIPTLVSWLFLMAPPGATGDTGASGVGPGSMGDQDQPGRWRVRVRLGVPRSGE